MAVSEIPSSPAPTSPPAAGGGIDAAAVDASFSSEFGPTPGQEDLVEKARDLIPLLRRNAARCDEERKVPEENLEALKRSGILRMDAPTRFGGREATMRTRIAVHSEIARGCGSTGWVSTIYSDIGWLLSMYPDAVQEEVFTKTSGLGCAGLVPGQSTVTPCDGGYILNGRWQFQTGSPAADWGLESAILDRDGVPTPVMCLVPRAEITVNDDWYTSGLSGTGSNSVSASDVFVPSERVLIMDAAANRSGCCMSETNRQLPLYRLPAQIMVLTSVGPYCGLSRVALETLLESIGKREIQYTFYNDRRAAAVTHLQVAEAASKIRAAHHLFFEVADRIDRHVEAGQEFERDEHALLWANAGYAVRLCAEAAEMIRIASGASGISQRNPMHRIVRDLQALSTHAFFAPTTALEIYGGIVCGQPPITPYL